ncbi:MAG: bifunctional imidazole glycerol-phosphate dehydratase/histidinol phosphatase [Bacteroidetes bacterium 24-39-8]|nr:MAG: bifunctional imidazole glycerol-phosphate dehydratase/histidinol phosphatase [Sphingobacteriia bacterium 35-40-8]OYZ50743.1 MAG: bifunctional imidazole glycerol-phosphate dehydratase/histidinol phosphatase [Bacteroidetes bacterium 24-39-8]OZA61970.1 MAG: bifunctional imidazole glycerol-phosphate dehydratase/histidinol phosphatase [Sphingobacteriia bacterium 39-39-8]HQR93421.1 bifunctional histidinol-phosphatase/imidazoleglycerol-phosphate dehydratase HisB [Sediminibacterium sp.]HQS55792
MRRVLFIDRDGTIINEVPPTYQIDDFSKLSFYPGVFQYLGLIAKELDYELVMVSNQDGLGTASFPEKTFWPVQDFIMETLANEDIHFAAAHFDRSFPHENLATRKPATGMLTAYLDATKYDLANSYVIGDRITDVQLAKNLGAKAIWLNADPNLGGAEVADSMDALKETVALETLAWEEIYRFLKLGLRQVEHQRNTNETKIQVVLNLDGSGKADIQTGLGFFDHMLDQIARHGKLDLSVHTKGDLHIDEHHTIEDTGLAIGEAFGLALADKRGMERYGFALPMDEASAQVLIDFGGRNWLVWDAEFKREKIGEMPTEMFFHFFKSFSDAAKCNLNISCKGDNEHHKIEAIFKAFAKAIRMAVKRDPFSNHLPSTKGVL